MEKTWRNGDGILQEGPGDEERALVALIKETRIDASRAGTTTFAPGATPR